MNKHSKQALLARRSFHRILIVIASLLVLTSAVSAQPTPSPSPFSFSGNVRAYYFTRTNLVQNKSNPNRTAFNLGGKLHAEYRITNSAWAIGASYFLADPLGFNGTQPGFKSSIDNTLPGFTLSTLGEAYLQFKDPGLQARIGDQVISTPWANPSDSRIKPVAFQGLDAQAQLDKRWSVGIDDMLRFEHRTSSVFFNRTLLTDAPAGNPSYKIQPSSGFQMLSLGYKSGPGFSATLYDYHFSNIANLIYLEGRYIAMADAHKPYFGLQLVGENQIGSALIGVLNNRTLGLQLGASLQPGLDFTLSADAAPWRSTLVATTCKALPVNAYFLPAGGSTSCVNNPNGTATVYYGGIASPYTEGYTSDPLFTTSISQGMVERHSAGEAYKLGSTWLNKDKRIRLILSEASYIYSNPGGANLTREFDADVTFFLNRVTSGPYHGLQLRERYADRRQPTAPNDFKYNRSQLEWDF